MTLAQLLALPATTYPRFITLDSGPEDGQIWHIKRNHSGAQSVRMGVAGEFVPRGATSATQPTGPHPAGLKLFGATSTGDPALDDYLGKVLIPAGVDGNGFDQWSTDGIVSPDGGTRLVIIAGGFGPAPRPWNIFGATGTGVYSSIWESTTPANSPIDATYEGPTDPPSVEYVDADPGTTSIFGQVFQYAGQLYLAGNDGSFFRLISANDDGTIEISSVQIRKVLASQISTDIPKESEIVTVEGFKNSIYVGDGESTLEELGGKKLTTLTIAPVGTAIENGNVFKAAYAMAKTMKAALPAGMIYVDVFLETGTYDLGATAGQTGLLLDTPGISIHGIGEKSRVLIKSAGRTIVYGSTSPTGVSLNNLSIETTSASATDAAFWPLAPETQFVMDSVILNCGSSSSCMRKDFNFSGTYKNCIFGPRALGSGAGSSFSGTLIDSAISLSSMGTGGDGILGATITRATAPGFPASDLSARFYYCICSSGTFGTRGGSSKAKFCVAGDGSSVNDT